MHYLLVGAGQLGSRHLQALAALPEAGTVYVVEPNPAAQKLAEERWNQVEGSKTKKLVFKDINAIREEAPACTAAVISTLSRNRLDVLAEVLSLGVKHILCEKILFQSIAAYRKAMGQVSAAGAKVYVNYTNRYFPVYSDIRAAVMRENAPLSMRGIGGNVGMGCNLIHELDTLEFMTGRKLTQVEVTIDQPLLPCKRGADFVEFTGTATASNAFGDRFYQEYAADSNAQPETTFSFGRRSIMVSQETRLWVAKAGQEPQPLNAIPVSQLTTRLIPEMLAGTTLMPTLEDTFSLNCLMLDAFNHALTGAHDEETLCAIT